MVWLLTEVWRSVGGTGLEDRLSRGSREAGLGSQICDATGLCGGGVLCAVGPGG